MKSNTLHFIATQKSNELQVMHYMQRVTFQLYICIYVSIHTYIYVQAHTHILCIHTYMHLYMHTCAKQILALRSCVDHYEIIIFLVIYISVSFKT